MDAAAAVGRDLSVISPTIMPSAFRVAGHSGSAVDMVDSLTVRKSGSGAAAARLDRQIDKQERFFAAAKFDNIKVPRIYRRYCSPGGLTVEMEFIAAKDFVQFLTESSRTLLDRFGRQMTDFISANLAESSEVEAAPALRTKLEDLANAGVPARYIDAALAHCGRSVAVPAGPCHGDLTLSNILFKEDEIYLIDFLDPFVESPLQDIVKLRQDTFHLWSLDKVHGFIDRPKIMIALNHLDRLFDEAFRRYSWYRENYRLFEFVNMLRILPYSRDEQSLTFLHRAIDRMLTAL